MGHESDLSHARHIGSVAGWSRRAMLAGALALPGLALARSNKESGPLILDLGPSAPIPFGAAVRGETLLKDRDYREAVARTCAIITPEIELKWAYVEPVRGVLHFTDVDEVARFAVANGKRMHGHALLWHKSIPDWATDILAAKDWSAIRSFIASVMPRYGAVTDSWDVINEPIETGYRMDGLRPSPFLEAFGPEYIRRALEDARMFAPDARLLINEYGLEYDLPVERDRRYLFLRLIESLKKAGVPLDTIGLQSHLDLSRQDYFDQKLFAAFLKELTAMGVDLKITELDVKETAYALPVEERDSRVAAAVKAYLEVVQDFPVRSISCWGLTDRYSWLTVTPEDLAKEGNHWPAGQGPGVNRGLPLDASLRSKPFFDEIQLMVNKTETSFTGL